MNNNLGARLKTDDSKLIVVYKMKEPTIFLRILK